MWVPPVYSPVSLRSVGKGLVAEGSAPDALEAELRGWYGAGRALATASGTHALQLALKAALAWNDGGGAVALPAFTCFDVASAAVWLGAPVTFYDVDPATLAPEPESLARAGETAGVVVVANLYGFPLDWDVIRQALPGGVTVVEDAAQGVGATWRGEQAGSLGDLSILSFGRGKGWTGGSGGAVLARRGREDVLPASLPEASGSRLVEAGKAAAVWFLARPSLYGLPARIPALGLGETHYRPPTDPRAIRPFAASLALRARERSLAEVAVRRANADAMREALEEAGAEEDVPIPLPGGESGELRLPVLVPGGEGEHRRLGVYRSYPRVLPDLEVLGPLVADAPACPGARRLARELVTLPTHSRMGRDGRKLVGSWLAGAAGPG